MVDTVEYTLFGADDVVLTQQQIQQLPYAARYARFGEQPQAVVMLAFIDRQKADRQKADAPAQYQWSAGEDDILLTQSGRLVGTRNLAGALNAVTFDLTQLRSEQPDPLGCLITRVTTRADLEACPDTWQATAVISNAEGSQYYKMSSRIGVITEASVKLPNGQEVSAVEVTEQLISTRSGRQWQYTNHYWVANGANSGEVIKASQQLVPAIPRLQTVSLKPVVSDPAVQPAAGDQ